MAKSKSKRGRSASKSRSVSKGRKRSTSKGRSGSKGRSTIKGRKRSTSKGRSGSKGASKSKVLKALGISSPYDTLGIRSGSHLSTQSIAPKLNEIELFGKYKPMNPMTQYASKEYPFAPGSNSSGFLSNKNSLANYVSSDDVFFDQYLDLTKKTQSLLSQGNNTTSLDVKEQYDPILTNKYPYMDVKAPETKTPEPASNPENKPSKVGVQTGKGRKMEGGFLDTLFSGSVNMSHSLKGKTIEAPKRVGLDDITYRVDVNSQDDMDYLRTKPLMVVSDEKGINKDKKYMIAHRNY